MLLTTVTESDPIYQFCEECIEAYMNTQEDYWIDAITEDALPDDEAIKVLRAEGKSAGDAIKQLARDASKLHWNPFKAAKMVADLGDFPSRAQGIGVHQPQVRNIQSLVFWNHKNTRRALLASKIAAVGLGALYKIHEYRNKPKTIIAQKIASLRKILNKFRAKIAGSKSEQEKSILQKVCSKIIGAIDKLLGFAQRKTDQYFAD